MTPSLRKLLIVLGLIVMAAVGTPATGQGLLVDHRPWIPLARSFEVSELAVDARIRDQVAEVRVSQTFHNPGSVDLESEYLFPLPEDAAVQDFLLMVDGRELPGRLLPKDEARRVFEEIVRRRKDPALLEYAGRGLFRSGVFPIPPHADRKVSLRYTQLLRRDRDVVEFAFPLGTQKFSSKPIGRMNLDVRIESHTPIKSLYSPSLDVNIRRPGDLDATVSISRRDVTPEGDFRLVYTLAGGPVGATVLSYRPDPREDGFFLLLASPEVRPADTRPLPKTVIFAIDRSGSMAGKKIEQARRALAFVLDNLRDDDLFNIVAYDDRVEPYKPELVRYSPSARSEAQSYVENLRPGGSTNIDGALTAALGMAVADDSRPTYVLFLTDGLPTVGELREEAIADHARRANLAHARLFTFGVGFDVNARLLDRLGNNGGSSEYVRPDEDIESHVARVYSRLTSPALTQLRVEFAGTDLNRAYPRDLPDLFEGGQFVWVGRYRRSGPTTVHLAGKVGHETRSLDFSADLADPGRGDRFDFVAKVWALRRVGDLIDQIDLHGTNRELVDELTALSTRYGIMTPYTSFLADERETLHLSDTNSARVRDNLQELARVDGPSGFAQRAAKQKFRGADKPLSPPMMMGMMGRMAQGPGNASGAADRGSSAASSSSPIAAGEANSAVEVRATEVPITLRQVGAKTFFRKGDRWLDSTVTPEDEAKAIRLVQFSDEFFRLVRDQPAEGNQYLAFDEPLTVKLGDKTYQIDRGAQPAQDRAP